MAVSRALPRSHRSMRPPRQHGSHLQPEGVLSGWLPILSPWTGNGWGICCPPTPGDQVLVLAQEGDAEHGIIIGRTFSNAQTSPITPVGELWVVHRSGSFIKLQNDGTIQMNMATCTSRGTSMIGKVRCRVCVVIMTRTHIPILAAARRRRQSSGTEHQCLTRRISGAPIW